MMKSLELFSGTGGLAKGLEEAGFQHAGFVEHNKHACASLRANFEQSKVFFGDIKEFDLATIKDVDLVAGGPPCQPFSLGGKHQAFDDHRDMFPFAIQAIDQLEPKAFIFENVKGLLRDSFSEYFDYILLRLTYPGAKPANAMDWQEHLNQLRRISKHSYIGTCYNVCFKLLNAADYGIPQNRERVIIVGLRSDLHTNWTWPEPTHDEDRLLWDMFMTGEYGRRHQLSTHSLVLPSHAGLAKINRIKTQFQLFEPPRHAWRTIRDALADVPDPALPHWIRDHQFRSGARSYPGHTGSEMDWPAKTIKAGDHGVPGGENMIRFQDGSVRYFTVFEAKRIQTFPDDFIIEGTWGEAMRQIGNAVPVALARLLGEKMADVLQNANSQPALKRA